MEASQEEEERILQMALEASNQEQVIDPNNPDVDNMTYEQLMELGENAGKISRGYTQEQINTIKVIVWREGKSRDTNCSICFEDFVAGRKVKQLKCGHTFDQKCIDKWLKTAKRCP